jgi:HAMP domain-containing protein
MPDGRGPGGGVQGDISAALNSVISKNHALTQELARISGLVGREGRLSERASMGSAKGSWAANIQSVNLLIGELARPTTEIARVIQAVAVGDLSQKITVEASGDIRALKDTINTMVDTLNSFTAEVTRVAKEVGTEGKLGGQAAVKGVSGTWKELTDNVNVLASNLTGQVRNIAKVTTAVAMGDLSQKITVEARGEIQELKNTINTMVARRRPPELWIRGPSGAVRTRPVRT